MSKSRSTFIMGVRSTKDSFIRWLTNSNVSHISYNQGWRRCQGDVQYIFFLSLFLISFLLSWPKHFCIFILYVKVYCCPWSHSMTHTHTHSVGVLWMRDQPVVVTSTWRQSTFTRHRHPCFDGVRTSNPSKRAAADVRLRLHGHRDRSGRFLLPVNLSLILRKITCF